MAICLLGLWPLVFRAWSYQKNESFLFWVASASIYFNSLLCFYRECLSIESCCPCLYWVGYFSIKKWDFLLCIWYVSVLWCIFSKNWETTRWQFFKCFSQQQFLSATNDQFSFLLDIIGLQALLHCVSATREQQSSIRSVQALKRKKHASKDTHNIEN